MTRALVTGGAGFIGANLVRRLLRDGFDVHVLTRPESKRWRLDDIVGDVNLLEVDVRARDEVRRALGVVRPEVVFHLAAEGGYSWETDSAEILETNVVGTAILLEACVALDVETFVNTGSSSEYGFMDHPPRETERLEPTSPYAVGKAASTMLCAVVPPAVGMRTVTLRLYSVFGPYEEPARLVPSLVLAALAGRLPPLASPASAHDFVYVDDVVEAYLLAAAGPSEPGAVYNIGTGRQTTLEEAVDSVRRLFGVSEAPSWGTIEDRAWDTEIWVADPSKVQRELGWRASVEFDEGLVTTADWFRSHPELRPAYLAGSTKAARVDERLAEDLP